MADALKAFKVDTQAVRLPRELMPNERPTVFVLDPASRANYPTETLRAFVDAGGSIITLGREGETDVAEGLPMELLSAFVKHPQGNRQLLIAIRAGFREAAARAETGRARAEAALRSREIGELTRIGVALGTERDLKTLLELIVTRARRITTSDAGSLYLVETGEEDRKSVV